MLDQAPDKEEEQNRNMISQTGKTLEEILPYLISGEPDD